MPVKYLIASTILRITESKINWKEKEESSVVTLFKILHFNVLSLGEAKDLFFQENESEDTFIEMKKKAHKFSAISMTNILIKSHTELLFNKKINLIQLLLESSNFE